VQVTLVIVGGVIALGGVALQHELATRHSQQVLGRVLLAEVADIRSSLEAELFSTRWMLGHAHPHHWATPDNPVGDPILLSLDPHQLGEIDDPELAADWVGFYRQLIALTEGASNIRRFSDSEDQRCDGPDSDDSTCTDLAKAQEVQTMIALQIFRHGRGLAEATRRAIDLENRTRQILGFAPADRSLNEDIDRRVNQQIALFETTFARVGQVFTIDKISPDTVSAFHDDTLRELEQVVKDFEKLRLPLGDTLLESVRPQND
jgi:hypothetical protein